MNKKILFLILIQMCTLVSIAFAQSTPCTSPTICVPDQHVQYIPPFPTGGTYWYSSHGVLNYSNNNAPTSPTSTHSLKMSSILNQGNGAFTCYKFEQGKTYHICYWVRNVSGWPGNWYGRLYVYAAKDLDTPASSNIPTGISTQLIDDSYYGPGSWAFNMSGVTEWEFISTTFTANADFNCLWVYPLNPQGPPPPGPAQYNAEYVVEVDDIRVSQEPATPYNFSVTNTGTIPIAGCNGQVQIAVNGLPPGAVATWTPANTITSLNPSINSSVIASPCSTTIYKIDITDPASTCATCVRATLYDTIEVNEWSEQSRIIYPDTVVPCTSPLILDYNDPATCSAMSSSVNYTWIEPDGITAHVGKTVTIPNANAYQTGEWTLKIQNSSKGCAEVRKFNITIGSCCISAPNFSFSGCNPVNFYNTGTGITNHVGTLWDFGDGTTSDLDSPIHTYDTSGGVFTVCMTSLYQDGQGLTCCNRTCKTVHVCNNPNSCVVRANYSYKAVPGWGNTFDFTDVSSGNGTICNYQWDFGGTIVTTPGPTIRYTFTTPGPWTVCLTATNCIYDASGNLLKSCTNKFCRIINPVQAKMSNANSAAMQASSQPLQVYPNPNNGNFTLILQKQPGSYQVVVRDKLRRVVYDKEHVFNNAPVKIAMGDIADGVYSVEVRNDKETFVQQVSIKK